MSETSEQFKISEIVAKQESPYEPYDRIRRIRQALPRDRKGYILARFALASVDDEPYVCRERAQEALIELSYANEEGVLSPPLPADCANSIRVHLETVHESARDRGLITKFLLAWAVDEGRCEGVG